MAFVKLQMTMIRILLLVIVTTVTSDLITDENAAKKWLEKFNDLQAFGMTDATNASWIYNTNLTDYNQQREVRLLIH